MTERRPLIEDNELFAKLVADARRREPPPEALESLHQKLVARPDRFAELAGSGARRWGWTALAGLGCLTVLGVVVGRRATIEHPPVGPSDVASSVAVMAPPPSLREEGPGVPSFSIDELPNSRPMADSKNAAPAVRTRAVPMHSGAPSESARPATPSVRRELELIALGREALSKGDTRACLDAMDLHDREFPSGQFALEAKVMRIEAAFAAGNRSGARQLARDYLAANPNSPYEARIRSLLSSPEDR